MTGNYAESAERENDILQIGERGRERKWREREQHGFIIKVNI